MAIGATCFGIPNGMSEIFVEQGNGEDSTNGYTRCFAFVRKAVGSDITYTSNTIFGDTFTINTKGVYAITWSDIHGNNTLINVITVNVSSLASDPVSFTYAQGVRTANYISSSFQGQTCWTGGLNAGDVVRCQGNANWSGTNSSVWMNIVRVA